ncbi:hypothetical protein P3342_008807 [Pyrenophora teres f. teres]|nr:hypothetical protein P3342_008807 [Pyrenophora teres f. teres]
MPQPPSRALSSKDLPPSVESAYYRKCIDLRRRITDIEDSNDGTRLRITRLSRGIQKMRLERAFLLEQLNKHMEYNVDDSDRSSSPPPTPTDKPLRSKRSHNRKGTPTLGGSGSAGGAEAERERLGVGQGALEGRMIQHGVHTMSSAQSTPDPAGRQERSYFGTIGTGSAAVVQATSPHAAVNGVPPPPTLPPLHSLPRYSRNNLQPRRRRRRRRRRQREPTLTRLTMSSVPRLLASRKMALGDARILGLRSCLQPRTLHHLPRMAIPRWRMRALLL